MDPNSKPLPKPTPETRPFWEGCAAGELRLQRCSACNRVQFPPRRFCSGCFADGLAWERASGRGSVLTYTVVTQATPAFAAEVPFVMALIRLDEGPTMLSGVRGCEPSDVFIGMPVEVEFERRSDEIQLPYFHPGS